ncbi:MAG: glycosylase [Cytophagales bacterium]|nr:MAG: glycosylase [Cytophagales bacterium]
MNYCFNNKCFAILILLTFFSIRLNAQKAPSSSLVSSSPKCPSWVPDAVFYEIYPQTFSDTDGDGIGDLKGIIQNLRYVKSLGVSAIWLNPFYESPFRDAGYDVSDFYKVAARYGTNEDAKKLFQEAHELGLKVIIDYVPGHTSIDHPWFKASASAKPNKYSNWYVWTNNTWDNGGSEFAGKMIQGFSERNGNFMTNYFWHQPALNFGFGKVDPKKPWQLPANHPDVRELKDEMKNVLKYWLDMGADGFRIDMAGSLTKNDQGSLECIKWWKEVREMLDTQYPNAFIVSEWSHPPAALEGGFHADYLHWIAEYENLFRKEQSRSLNGVSPDGYSYFDQKGMGDISAFMNVYLKQLEETKSKGFISIPVGNHDLSRITNNRSKEDLEIIYAFLMTMPGVPFFYYGDEIGMKQLLIENAKEGCYKPRAGARTPMQWNTSNNAGFSAASSEKLWLPIDSDPLRPTVQTALNNPTSIWYRTKHLIELRRKEKALYAQADFKVLYMEKDKYPFIYSRSLGNEKIIVALNPSGKELSVEIPLKIKGKLELLSGTPSILNTTGDKTMLTMKGVSYSIYKLK